MKQNEKYFALLDEAEWKNILQYLVVKQSEKIFSITRWSRMEVELATGTYILINFLNVSQKGGNVFYF